MYILLVFFFGWLSFSHSPYSKYSKYQQLHACSKFREIVYVVYYELLYVNIFQNKTSHKWALGGITLEI